VRDRISAYPAGKCTTYYNESFTSLRFTIAKVMGRHRSRSVDRRRDRRREDRRRHRSRSASGSVSPSRDDGKDRRRRGREVEGEKKRHRRRHSSSRSPSTSPRGKYRASKRSRRLVIKWELDVDEQWIFIFRSRTRSVSLSRSRSPPPRPSSSSKRETTTTANASRIEVASTSAVEVVPSEIAHELLGGGEGQAGFDSSQLSKAAMDWLEERIVEQVSSDLHSPSPHPPSTTRIPPLACVAQWIVDSQPCSILSHSII